MGEDQGILPFPALPLSKPSCPPGTFSTGEAQAHAQSVPHLEEGHYPEGRLHGLHLRVLCQQHVLNS